MDKENLYYIIVNETNDRQMISGTMPWIGTKEAAEHKIWRSLNRKFDPLFFSEEFRNKAEKHVPISIATFDRIFGCDE